MSSSATFMFLEYHQCQHIMMFLIGLNENFSNIRGQILLIDPLPPISKVFSLVIQEKKRREIDSMIRTREDIVAFMKKK